jgi:hypothetical protein
MHLAAHGVRNLLRDAPGGVGRARNLLGHTANAPHFAGGRCARCARVTGIAAAVARSMVGSGHPAVAPVMNVFA